MLLYPACSRQQAVDDLLNWEQRDAGMYGRESELPQECSQYRSCVSLCEPKSSSHCCIQAPKCRRNRAFPCRYLQTSPQVVPSLCSCGGVVYSPEQKAAVCRKDDPWGIAFHIQLSAAASAAANNNLQAGRNFSSQGEFAWKCPHGVIRSM